MAEFNSAATGRNYREGIQVLEPKSEDRPEADILVSWLANPLFGSSHKCVLFSNCP